MCATSNNITFVKKYFTFHIFLVCLLIVISVNSLQIVLVIMSNVIYVLIRLSYLTILKNIFLRESVNFTAKFVMLQ